MSTKVAASTLSMIFKYGLEALTNRRKELFLIAFIFLLLPQVALSFAWANSTKASLALLHELPGKPPIQIIEGIVDILSQQVLTTSAIVFSLGVIGVLALARTSMDYFESRPSPILDVLKRAMKVFLTKGIGSLIFIVFILPILALHPLPRAIAISLLLMLPITLVSSHKGGFKTSMDTLFLRYASVTPQGKWPTFFNVLSLSGIFLTLLFAFSFLIDMSKVIDTWLEIPAGILETQFSLFNLQAGFAELIGMFLTMMWDASWFALLMPFAAATFHLSTIPEDHVDFQVEV